jgi:hypothetical protein
MTHHKPRRLRCPSCQLARIQGIVCHETGCPDRHLFTFTSCLWCGQRCKARRDGRRFCSGSCYRSYTR